MDYSSGSILNDTHLNKLRISRRYSIFIVGILLICGICVFPSGADNNQKITLIPIGNFSSDERVNISGTSTIETCKQIGIEIFPKLYWDSVCAYAKEDSAGKVVFNPMASSSENFDPSRIKLARVNADETHTSQIMNLPKDHVLITTQIEKTVLRIKHWNVLIEKNDNKTLLHQGIYHVNIWDATDQKQNYDNPMPNGWDIIHQKIYPNTGRVNLWDAVNQKDMQYGEFAIE